MKTFEIPMSDCGCFTVGTIGPESFETEDGKPYPEFGIIVWYETAEAAKAAFKSASEAHWPSLTAAKQVEE